METQKVVVVLLIIAILMSVISIVVSVSTISGIGSANVPIRETIRNIFTVTNKDQNSGGGEIGITILPNGSGQ